MKKYAIFLPQFHSIPENDMWWGENFTEWTNVKKAKPLFKNHCQPRHPLNNYYYNLLDKSAVEWQTDLLNRYGIDGMVYYHYYFSGKMLLEKPSENLLKWKDIPQHFFFCWANHSWVKSWNGTSELLIEQTYGNENEWEKHFQYLLPFFKDERYEKCNNKPMFMIFKSSFSEKSEIFRYFNKRCLEEGFDGIYLIESYHGEISFKEFLKETSELTSLFYYREPAVSQFAYLKSRGIIFSFIHKVKTRLRKIGVIKKPFIINGNQLMENKIYSEPLSDKVGHGIWYEWDNTSRHEQRGYIITPYQKILFDKYMEKIKNEKFLFINAWNEWCEGMVLEPTTENGYKYLEWIKEWSGKND